MSTLGTATKKPALTPIDTGNTALDAWVKKVCEIHAVEEGARGKGQQFKLDKKPSYRELMELGIVFPMARGQGLRYLGSPVDGFLPGNGADPAPDYSRPQPPQNVIATGGFGVIFIEWNDPLAAAPIPFFSHTEIWRSATDNLGTAVLLGTTVSTLYDDSVESDATFYYWVRFIKDVKGTVIYGPFNATAGTGATSAADVDHILEVLEGSITETHLFSTLNGRIDLIDGSDGLPGSVNARILIEANLRAAEDAALNAFIISVQTASTDGDTALASDVSVLYTVSGDNTAAITAESIVRASADDALASDVTTLYAEVGDNAAAIVTEATTRATADTALSSLITTLQAEVDDNAAAISTEAITRADEDSAIAALITTVQSEVDGNTAAILVNASAIDGVEAEYFVKLDVNGYVSGFGIASSGGSSTFLINADNFAIGKPGYVGELPFVLGTVGGVTRIALNAATYIPDATITEAKIGSAAITTAKIQDAAITAAKIGFLQVFNAHIGSAAISEAKIASAAVATAKIQDAAITTAKIGDLQVDTLKIAGNAVTVPQYSSGSGGTITTSWATAVSITVNWGSNIPGAIMLTGSVNCLAGGSGAETLTIRFRQGSTGATDGDVGVSAASGFSVGLTGTAGFVPNTTSETYYLEVKKVGATSYTMGAKNLLIVGIKK